MFQKILKLFGLKKSLTADQILRYPKPRQYSRDEHNIRVADIDPDAVKTLQRIHQMGCRAYIVGGSVRDLLLGRKPKDYDVVTDAHPQELRRMFANSRIIGRRFRLVHVVFRGNKIIEVSTARSLPSNRAEAKNSDELYLKRDHEADWREWEQRIERIARQAKKVTGVTTEQFMPEIHYRVPHLRIRWDETKVKATVKDIIRELREGRPSIEVRSNTNEGLELGVWMLKPGEDAIVAQRVHEVLSAHRA